jgi:predicted metalloprotease with PDZ domain
MCSSDQLVSLEKNEAMRSLLLSFLFLTITATAQQVNYSLRMDKPQNHYFQVTMELIDMKMAEPIIKMPVWAPGSYLVREFAKHVNQVSAKDENGAKLPIIKLSKNAWKIKRGKAKRIIVEYEVYAFELSVRTSFLDASHGFVSGSGVFMFVDGLINKPGKLNVLPHASFKKVSTSLREAGESVAADGQFNFQYETYDELVDCPIEIGNHEVFTFNALGIPHTVAIYGEGNHSVDQLKTDMAKIVETTASVIGENPNDRYTFLIHNVVDGGGGLEHSNSCVLSMSRWDYTGSGYLGFLSLVAHEYFHLWNVKRIRPIELGPFDYDKENYTSLLWVMEGFTSYYDELLLRRAGIYSEKEYLDKLQSTINYVEGSVGSRVQPVAHASFDAWIKAYRPNENSSNTTMTYYSRGAMLGAILDADIISKYEGKKSLDDFLRVLYVKFYKQMNRGFTTDEFKQELSNFMGKSMNPFFEQYVDGTEVAPVAKAFMTLGLGVSTSKNERPSFGATLRQEGGKVIVKGVRAGSAAEDGGLSPNDEIIGYNGYRVDQSAVEQWLNGLAAGQSFKLLVSRDEKLFELAFTMTNYAKMQFQLSLPKESNSKVNYWLRTTSK